MQIKMCIIKCLEYNTTKKEFKKHLFNLIFKKAKNKEEAKNNKYIQIPNSVTSIEKYAFCECVRLTSINIPNSVTSLGEGAFGYCKSLTSITIPNSVTLIGEYAFKGCESLTSITIPISVTSIGEHAFKGCESLTSITIPKNFENYMEIMFDIGNLTKLIVLK